MKSSETKTLLLLILLVTVFLGSSIKPVHADYTNGISIQSVNAQPSVLKVGDAFSVTATLVNNSTIPIAVDGGTCIPNRYPLVPFFTVTLDDHAKIKAQNLTCAGVGLGKILNHGENLTGTSPDSTFSYIATKSGTAIVTVTFSYHGINQTDPTQAYSEQTISKSFKFTIADNDTSTSYGGLTGFRVAEFKSDHATYPIWYKITSGAVVGTPLDLPAKALIFMINASSDGELTVELPKSIIDSKNGTKDIPYYVAVDDVATLIGKPFPVQAKEINDDNLRIVKINFTKTTKDIEIVGTYFVENHSSKTEHPSKTFSPLQQFRSGIKSEYVKCNVNLHLIIKAKDGSFACVTIETGKSLVYRGWATTFGTGISADDYTKCNTLYPESNTGTAVLYMSTNSFGKICVKYHNLNNTPTSIGMRIFEANNLTQNASSVTTWASDSMLEGNASKTIVYFITTGAKAGFYGVSLNCGGIPLAVGYDINSTITARDFPWIGQVFHCGAITYDSSIEGTAGIGAKYISYP